MAKTIQDAKMQIKYSTITGVVPTIPGNDDHTTTGAGAWLSTDVYIGEFFLNVFDNILWTRTNSGIIKIPIINGLTPIGAANRYLSVNESGTELEYRILNPIINTTVNMLLNRFMFTVLVDATDGNKIITLPPSATFTNHVYNIKKIDPTTNTVTIQANGTEFIDDENTKILFSQWDSGTIHCNGTNWFRI